METTDTREEGWAPEGSGAGPGGGLVYRKEAARWLGISTKTLQNYEKDGRLKSWKNKVNGRVYYDRDALLCLLGSRLPQDRKVVLYCRAATIPDQGAAGINVETRLRAQVDRCQEYCVKAGIRVDLILKDIGKGWTVKDKPGMDKLMNMILRKEVSMIVVETGDRLARWGMGEVWERFLLWHGVELHVISPHWQREEYREEMKEDLAGILYEAKRIMGGA